MQSDKAHPRTCLCNGTALHVRVAWATILNKKQAKGLYCPRRSKSLVNSNSRFVGLVGDKVGTSLRCCQGLSNAAESMLCVKQILMGTFEQGCQKVAILRTTTTGMNVGSHRCSYEPGYHMVIQFQEQICRSKTHITR